MVNLIGPSSMNLHKKIIAVVVTYNRRELLQRVVESLRKQSVTVSEIIIVNNGSTDGTHDWLDKQEGLTIIHQENVGGSGGFYRGMQEASKKECDWIWCMDDDVFPTETCLEQLLQHADNTIGILCPRRIMDGEPFHTETKKLNLTNPFKNTFNNLLTKDEVDQNPVVDIQGMAFEGPLIRRCVVEEIGLPNKDLFILYDDTDYSYRAILAGHRVSLIRDAILEKYRFSSNDSELETKKRNKWKLAYHIRNSAYFCHRYGKNIFVRSIGGFPFTIRMQALAILSLFIDNGYSLADFKLYFVMMIYGIQEKMGKIKQ